MLYTTFLRLDRCGTNREGGNLASKVSPQEKVAASVVTGWESARSVGAHAGEGLRFHTLQYKPVQRPSACDHCCTVTSPEHEQQ